MRGYTLHHERQRPKGWMAAVGLMAVAVAAAALSIWLWKRGTPVAPSANTVHGAAEVPATGMESRVLFAGDIYWGRSVNTAAQRSPLKNAFPFSGLHTLDRERYDAWIGNLECPSVPGVAQPYDLEVEKLLFNCPSSYLPEFAKWFTAVSLANNHTANQNGQSGIAATRTALEPQGVQYFGHYDPEKLEDVCEIVSLPVRVTQDGSSRKAEAPIAFCGYHGVAKTPSVESVAVMQQYAPYMPVIVYPHMGTEYQAVADPVRTRLYRSMIDAGADVVLGGHPHWIQPAEAYKHKLIVYSLGDFIFDQGPGETQRGAVIDLTLSSTDTAALGGWLDLGEHCHAFKDDCLAEARAKHIVKPKLKFSYAAEAVDLSGKITKLGDEQLQRQVLERLNWNTVSRELSD